MSIESWMKVGDVPNALGDEFQILIAFLVIVHLIRHLYDGVEDRLFHSAGGNDAHCVRGCSGVSG